MSKVFALLLAGSTALTSLSTNAQTETRYGTEGWWGIYHDTIDNGDRLCFARTFYKDYNIVMKFFALSVDGERHWAISLTNDKWTGRLTEGTKYNLTLEAPHNKKWSLSFEVIGAREILAYVSKDVMNSIAMDKDGFKMTLRAAYKTHGPFRLDNSAAAIRAVVHCVNDGLKTANKPAEKKPEQKKSSGGISTGTGFFVAPGYIVTNHHVIKNCTEPPMVRYPKYGAVIAYSKGIDEANDLVILETKATHHGIASFRRVPKLGEAVASFGFPLFDVLASDGNFTLGNVTSTTGMGGDSRFIQFSAPIQYGNSGGPLLDMYGRVVGISESFLKQTTDGSAAPQNVNFAITASVAMNFLEIKELNPQLAPTAQKMEPEQLAEHAKKFTVQIACKS